MPVYLSYTKVLNYHYLEDHTTQLFEREIQKHTNSPGRTSQHLVLSQTRNNREMSENRRSGQRPRSRSASPTIDGLKMMRSRTPTTQENSQRPKQEVRRWQATQNHPQRFSPPASVDPSPWSYSTTVPPISSLFDRTEAEASRHRAYAEGGPQYGGPQ